MRRLERRQADGVASATSQGRLRGTLVPVEEPSTASRAESDASPTLNEPAHSPDRISENVVEQI
jgi:hypothetical protein